MTRKYDYMVAMKEDIKEYIQNEVDTTEFVDREELEEKLNDALWTVDSVTGNRSGSYTMNNLQSKSYVFDNIDLLKEAYEDFCCKDRFADDFFKNDFCSMDVTIRCYLLCFALSEVLDEIENTLSFAE